jgi:glycosyltransferase involved in cell wall biosynthesis
LRYAAGSTRLLDGFPTTLLPFVNLGPAKPISAGFALLRHLLRWGRSNRGRARAILTYNVTNPPGIASVIAGRLTGTKVFAVVADIQVPGSGLVPDTLLRRLEFRLQRFTLPRLDGLIVLTRRMADDFAPRTPFIQVEGAVAGLPRVARSAPAGRDAIPRDEPVVLMYSGGLSELKGIPLLLDAFRLLPDQRFRLWITGTGPLSELVAASAARDPRITFWGFVEYGRVLELYQQATLLINPHSTRHASARYLFPSKLVEFLATGTPVISTCSTPEVLEEYGDVLYPLPEDSPERLAELITAVSALPPTDRDDMGARARRLVQDRKSWPVQGARVARFIDQALAPLPRGLAGASHG